MMIHNVIKTGEFTMERTNDKQWFTKQYIEK
jgi:hypothetical protein